MVFPINMKSLIFTCPVCGVQGEYAVTNCECTMCGDRCLEPYETALFTTVVLTSANKC